MINVGERKKNVLKIYYFSSCECWERRITNGIEFITRYWREIETEKFVLYSFCLVTARVYSCDTFNLNAMHARANERTNAEHAVCLLAPCVAVLAD